MAIVEVAVVVEVLLLGPEGERFGGPADRVRATRVISTKMQTTN